MPSLFRALLAVLHAATFVALSGPPYVSTCVSASPIAMPLPFTTADWTHNILAHREPKDATFKSMRLKHGAAHNQTDATRATRTARNNLAESSPSSRERRQNDNINILNNISFLNNYYNTAQEHARNLKDLAAYSSNPGSGDADTQRKAKEEATGLQTGLLGFQAILVELAADKGLANYDKNSQLETLLKNIINANKDALSSLQELVQGIPTFGPILGPIVYDVKCIIDEVLDATENLTDGLLNLSGLNV